MQSTSTAVTTTASMLPLGAALRREHFCRLCMQSSGSHLQRIYREEATPVPVNPELVAEIRNLIDVELSFQDDHQSLICLRCLHSLEDFFYFRNRCQAVDVRVRELRAKTLVPAPEVVPPEHHDKECQAGPVPAEPESPLGVFRRLEYCREGGSDVADVYRMKYRGFVFRASTLLAWRCEVETCECRLDVDRNLGDCRELCPHNHAQDVQDRRGFGKFDAAVERYLNSLEAWSTTHVPCSTMAESVLNIETFSMDDTTLSELPFNESYPPNDASFFNCQKRGLSMILHGHHYLLSAVRAETRSSRWRCTWPDCNAIVRANSQLTSFRLYADHPHPHVELEHCPTTSGQTRHPSLVTFYRVAKSVIGVQHDGFHYRLAGFSSTGKSVWECTWRSCRLQLKISTMLDCRLVPADCGHTHDRPTGPGCTVANMVSPVLAQVELNGKRGLVGHAPDLDGMPQLEIKLTKVVSDTLKGFLLLESGGDITV